MSSFFLRFKNFGAALAVLGLFFSPALPAFALTLDQGTPPVQLAPNSPAVGLQNAFIDVAAKVSPAVVNIGSEWTEDVQGYGNMNELFNFWFGNPGNGMQPRQNPTFKRKQRALGSGFLVTSDGYIVTNAHVVGKAEKVTVTMEDGTTYPAKIIGKYEKVDIAVVKIEDGKRVFPHVVFGNSDDIKVGQWAIAIGNPFALDHTVTTGVISAKGRSVEIGEANNGSQSYIQTDASINPGNSGGPLCNIEGEVIGVNTAIYSQSGGSVGIGFAIPSNIARKTAEDLVNNGKIVRAGLGAVVQTLSPAMAKSFGLASDQGALLSDINPGSAAAKAGLKPGDVVLALNGTPVTDSANLVSQLYTFRPGDTITLTIQRNGARSDVPVILQTLDDAAFDKKASKDNEGSNGTFSQGQSESLGLSYQDQTPDIRAQLPQGAPKGPVITDVGQQSPAAQSGLQPGDVILKLGNREILTSNQLTVLLKKSDLKNGVRLFVWRDGQTLYTILQSGD